RGLRFAAVDLRVHDRGGGGEGAVAHQLLGGDQVGGPLLVAAAGPHVGAAGKAGEGDVQVVGRAAHHAGGEGGGQLDGAAAALEVLAASRDQGGDVDQAAVVGRRRQHLVGVLVLQVIDAGHGARRLGQLRVLERVGDLLAVQPDLAGVAAQAVKELLAGAGGCRRLLLRGCHHASWCVSGGSCSPLASRPSRS